MTDVDYTEDTVAAARARGISVTPGALVETTTNYYDGRDIRRRRRPPPAHTPPPRLE